MSISSEEVKKMATQTFNEEAYQGEKQFHNEWLIRKAKRVAYQARNARLIKEYRHNGSGRILKVYTAERSRGYQTDYQRVTTFYLLIYENGNLIHGQTMTEREWRKREPQYVALCK